jgi:hypothetical protein
MQLKRLWQTLVYFDVIPWLGCFKRLFRTTKISNINQVNNMDKILIYQLETELIIPLVENLLSNNYRVVILNQNFTEIKNILAQSLVSKVEIITADLSNLNNLKPKILARVKTIISSNQAEINKLITWVNQYLKAGEQLLFDFTEPSEEITDIWGAVDDVVMGGISESQLQLVPNKAIFTGVVSTENNGGFASVRTKNVNPPWNLSAYEGIQLKVQGDGKRYKFITRCEGKWDGISYCYSFDTLNNCWTTIKIPFRDLRPVFRAKTISEATTFDSSKVYSLQLMLSKFEYDGDYNPQFQAGFFALEIESIKTYGGKKVPQLILISSEDPQREITTNQLNCVMVKGKNIRDQEAEIAQVCSEIITNNLTSEVSLINN